MGLNYSDIFTRIEELVASDRSVSDCMGEIISICSRDVPHPDWKRLAALNYDGDGTLDPSWVAQAFEKQPAPFPVQGLWFGLNNPSDGVKAWADMYVGSTAKYAPDDEELSWLWKSERHDPENADASSACLRNIYEIGYAGDKGLGNDAEWPLCLAFGAFAVRSLLKGQSARLVASTAPRIGVVVGFDSGDMLKIGELTDREFVTTGRL